MWTANEIARLCYEHYGVRLPKQGKPEPNREWTLLAAVVKIQRTADQVCDCPDKPLQGETFSPWSAPLSLPEMIESYMAMQGQWFPGVNGHVRRVPLLSARWRSTAGGGRWPGRNRGARSAVGMLWSNVLTYCSFPPQ